MNPSSSFPNKIRIIYTDPYATDSSTDEEEMNKPKNRIPAVKRFVKEITCSVVPFDFSEDDGKRPVAAYRTRKQEYKMMAAEENKYTSSVPSSPSSVLDEANHEKEITMEDQYVVKKAVKEYEFVQEGKSIVEEVFVEASIAGLWEPPSASDSWEELFGRRGLENHMSNLRNHLLLNDDSVDHRPENVNLIDLPDMKIDNEDMAWADEILTRN
ncbi:hypothetical protein HRI_003304100 [Hibiscus trionum]|uniref:Uncharacterized protein n=1 Tax=Hibiscus trionum TaxID=183268 RepID=A0A9W7MCE7_HIBTR|nr:hypothetical protein HRI_003304100 [Hibiscus trionum]